MALTRTCKPLRANHSVSGGSRSRERDAHRIAAGVEDMAAVALEHVPHDGLVGGAAPRPWWWSPPPSGSSSSRRHLASHARAVCGVSVKPAAPRREGSDAPDATTDWSDEEAVVTGSLRNEQVFVIFP